MKEDLEYKVVFVGPNNVGKSSLITKLVYDRFENEKITTIKTEITTQFLTNKVYSIKYFDTALVPSAEYFSHASIAVVMVDPFQLNKQQILDSIAEARQFAPGIKIILVISKADLVINSTETKTILAGLAAESNYPLFEISAKQSVQQLQSMIEKLLDDILNQQCYDEGWEGNETEYQPSHEFSLNWTKIQSITLIITLSIFAAMLVATLIAGLVVGFPELMLIPAFTLTMQLSTLIMLIVSSVVMLASNENKCFHEAEPEYISDEDSGYNYIR